jgi:hypothetical protein
VILEAFGCFIDDRPGTLQGHVALLCERYLHVYTLNGAHIATAKIPDAPSPGFTMGSALPAASAKHPRFCGGISFHQREFSKDGPLFAVGMDNNVCLWRVVPGSINEPPWSLQEMKRWPGPEQNGDVSAVRFIEWVDVRFCDSCRKLIGLLYK